MSRPARSLRTPGHLLDHSRFLADSGAAFQREQIELLRAANPRWSIQEST